MTTTATKLREVLLFHLTVQFFLHSLHQLFVGLHLGIDTSGAAFFDSREQITDVHLLGWTLLATAVSEIFSLQLITIRATGHTNNRDERPKAITSTHSFSLHLAKAPPGERHTSYEHWQQSKGSLLEGGKKSMRFG